MRQIVFLSIITCIICSSCTHRPHGPRPLTAADSARRVAAIAQQKRLRQLSQIREDLIGPTDIGSGTGEVKKGAQYNTDAVNDSLTDIVRKFEKRDNKYKQALQDSSTDYGALLNRFKVLDAEHKYLSATYTAEGHLLTFHCEAATDDRHTLDYELRFDQGRLIYISESRSIILDPEDQTQQVSNESYFMSGATLLHCYLNTGQSQPHRGRVEPLRMTKYTITGDLTGHVARTYNLFLKDYDQLLSQPLEAMIYTSSSPAVTAPTDKAPDAAPPSRGRAFQF